MTLSKLPYEPCALLDFFTEGLQSLGAVSEQSWHDRLQVLAEGKAAKVWGQTESVIDLELYFPSPSDTNPRDASREVFPGCPLTFRLADELRGEVLSFERAGVRFDDQLRAPSLDTAARTWQSQFPGSGRWEQARPFAQDWAFSILCLLRCEIQAIDQHWSLHRLAISLPDGAPDHDLVAKLDFAVATSPGAVTAPWPEVDPAALRRFIIGAIEQEMRTQLAEIQTRQEQYLRRELERIDDYFANYERELRTRKHSTKEKTLKLEERLAAAKHEHERRRQDQVQRHEIRVLPHVDAILLLAEPCWKTAIKTTLPAPDTREAIFLPRARQWRILKTG